MKALDCAGTYIYIYMYDIVVEVIYLYRYGYNVDIRYVVLEFLSYTRTIIIFSTSISLIFHMRYSEYMRYQVLGFLWFHTYFLFTGTGR